MTFGLSVVYVHLSSYAMSVGHGEMEAAALFSAMGISNFIGRLVYGFIGQIPRLTPITIYGFGFFLSGVVVACTPFAESYLVLMICSSLFGGFTGTFGTTLPQVKLSESSKEILHAVSPLTESGECPHERLCYEN